ncbi:MAG: SUMF1/EgtB/PvdO family nonheme iron enzyme [Kiritimatiellia bacterium]|jgi:formylglycine-generating enzyme required for sulfatase activity|nr:SUMF1/EgtB/PvdO family nonheme iron enzyme [Kiritimatiellia bacterium]
MAIHNHPHTLTRWRTAGWLWIAALVAGLAAWFLVQEAIPAVLGRLTPSRITPTLLDTLNLRVWTVVFSAVFLTMLAIGRTLRPAWRPSLARLGFGLAGLALLLRWATPEIAFNSIVRPDGVHFSVAAQQLVTQGTLRVPTGLALLPARTLPGPSVLQALTQWIQPGHPGYGIIAVWLCAALSLGLAFWAGRRFYGAAAGGWALLLLALSPAHGWYARQLMSEIPWGLLILASCGLLAVGIRHPGRAAMAGLLAGLGLTIKSSHMLILIGMLAGVGWVHFRKQRVRGTVWLALLIGMVVGGMPALLYNRLVLGDWLQTAYHIYWPGWASATAALNIRYLWAPPLINGAMGNVPYYLLAILGLDPRPERMILLPFVALLLVWLWMRSRRSQPAGTSLETSTFQHVALCTGGLYGVACMLYSFQEPRFFLPIVPLVFVALAGPLARGAAGLPAVRRLWGELSLVVLAGLLGLGAAIITVETTSARVPERQLLQQLADAAKPYDVLVSDEDPVLLTTAGVWTAHTRVLPLLLPDELWFPGDPARLFREKGVAVEPFAGTVPSVTQALNEGRTVAAWVRRPHTRPAAWQAFTNAFDLVLLTRDDLPGFYEIRLRQTAELVTPAPPPPPPPRPSSVQDRDTPPPAAPQFFLGMEIEGAAMARERSLPPHPVTLDPFELETTAVDQESYAAFLNDEWLAGHLAYETNDSRVVISWMIDAAAPPLALCELRDNEPNAVLRFDAAASTPFRLAEEAGPAAGRLPMVGVSWYGAAAYCNWHSRATGRPVSYTFSSDPAQPVEFQDRGGYRLPTEAEWEWTATWDGTHKRRYVWGDDWNPAQANLAESPRPERAETDPFTLPVDLPPPWRPQEARPLRHQHLAGNVWEWCQDWFADYEAAAATNPAGPLTGEIKIVRGGSFRTRRESAWAAFRGIATPVTMTPDIGFRMARSTR